MWRKIVGHALRGPTKNVATPIIARTKRLAGSSRLILRPQNWMTRTLPVRSTSRSR